MPRTTDIAIAVIGIDIGKNSFHVVGLDKRGAIVLCTVCNSATVSRVGFGKGR